MILNSFKKQIPNLLTLANLSCGVLSIVSVLDDNPHQAAFFIFLAVLFDFFDGFIARLLKVSGELGKQLDSLADCVTFGVAPGFILYHINFDYIHFDFSFTKYAFLLIPIFSAYRLAKFNIDTRQSESFIGVPTPITGVMIASWVFIEDTFENLHELIFFNDWFYLLFCILVSFLLISELPLVSLKFKKGKKMKDYTVQIVIAVIGLLSILLFQWLAIPIIYLVYVLSSVFINFAKK